MLGIISSSALFVTITSFVVPLAEVIICPITLAKAPLLSSSFVIAVKSPKVGVKNVFVPIVFVVVVTSLTAFKTEVDTPTTLGNVIKL